MKAALSFVLIVSVGLVTACSKKDDKKKTEPTTKPPAEEPQAKTPPVPAEPEPPAEIDIDRNEKSHARTLFLRDRRPELYARWLSSR